MILQHVQQIIRVNMSLCNATAVLL